MKKLLITLIILLHSLAFAADASAAELVEQLRADRLWLLQQIDGGRWPELRLDLAALERELGQVLEQAQEKLNLPANG